MVTRWGDDVVERIEAGMRLICWRAVGEQHNSLSNELEPDGTRRVPVSSTHASALRFLTPASAMHAQDEVFDSLLFLSKGPLLVPLIGITYPCTFTPVPPSFPPQPVSANPAKTPPLRNPNNPVLLPTSAAWGMCTSLPVRNPRRLACRLADRVSHEGISVLGVHVGFTDAQKESD